MGHIHFKVPWVILVTDFVSHLLCLFHFKRPPECKCQNSIIWLLTLKMCKRVCVYIHTNFLCKNTNKCDWQYYCFNYYLFCYYFTAPATTTNTPTLHSTPMTLLLLRRHFYSAFTATSTTTILLYYYYTSILLVLWLQLLLYFCTTTTRLIY